LLWQNKISSSLLLSSQCGSSKEQNGPRSHNYSNTIIPVTLNNASDYQATRLQSDWTIWQMGYRANGL